MRNLIRKILKESIEDITNLDYWQDKYILLKHVDRNDVNKIVNIFKSMGADTAEFDSSNLDDFVADMSDETNPVHQEDEEFPFEDYPVIHLTKDGSLDAYLTWSIRGSRGLEGRKEISFEKFLNMFNPLDTDTAFM